jgi:hypothetical protein
LRLGRALQPRRARRFHELRLGACGDEACGGQDKAGWFHAYLSVVVIERNDTSGK